MPAQPPLPGVNGTPMAARSSGTLPRSGMDSVPPAAQNFLILRVA